MYELKLVPFRTRNFITNLGRACGPFCCWMFLRAHPKLKSAKEFA